MMRIQSIGHPQMGGDLLRRVKRKIFRIHPGKEVVPDSFINIGTESLNSLFQVLLHRLDSAPRVPERCHGLCPWGSTLLVKVSILLVQARAILDQKLYEGSAPFIPIRAVGLTVNTGQEALRTTRSATLPIRTWESPERPWVPSTMRSTGISCAVLRISRNGVPSLKIESTFMP